MLTPENYPVILGHEPVASDALLDTSQWINLENANGVLITVIESYAVDATPLVLTVHEGTAASGTTALSAANGQEFKIWFNVSCAASDVMVKKTDAVTFTLDGVTAGNLCIVQFYVSASLLSNGYKWIQLAASAGNAGNIVTVLYQIEGGRYQQTTPPTYIV